MKRQLTGKLLTEVKGHGVALLATIGALVWRLALDPYLGDELPYVTFFVAIALTTWYAGLAASLTAIVLSALSANWFFIPPRLSLHIGDRSQVIGLLTFGAVSLIFMAFGHSMHRGRKRAEELAEGLRVTEERLTLAQEASQVGSFDWNLETGISTWSPELCAIYGIRPGDLDKTKAGWERYLHPDDREDVIQTIERSRTSGGAEEREFRIVRPNGDVRWLVARWRWIRNRAGQPVRFTGVTLDITERKRADEASREGEARSRAIFESALDALITMDAEGRVQDFNPAAERMFGYSQSEALGQPVADLIIPPPLRDRHREGLRQHVAAGDPAMLGRRIQMTAMRADGTEIPVELSIVVTQRPGRAPFFTASVRDLTERLKGEAATHQLASVLDNSTDFIGMCDLKGVPFYVNKYGLSMVGLESLEEAQSTHITQFFFPEDVDLIVNEFLPSVLEKGDGEIEIRFRHFKTGAALWMLYRVFVLKDPKGERIGLATVSRNISERKAGERATAHLAAIVTSSDDAIISKDLTGIVVTWNHGAERLFGYKAEEMIGQSITKLIPSDRQGEERRILDKVTGGEVVEPYETIRRRKDGSELHVSLTVSPLFDGQGRPIGASKIARDITDLVRHQELLAHSRERLRQALQYQEAVFSNIGEGLYTVDRQGLIVSVNAAAERLLGWTKDELIGRNMHELAHYKHPDGKPLTADHCAMLGVLVTGSPLVGHEDLFIRRDGTFFDVVCSVSPIRSGDEITGLVIVFRDVTQQKRAEDALRDRERALTAANDELNQQKTGLAEANKELQSFSYSVSHDLRAPLRTIDAYVRIVEEDHGRELNDEVRRCLGIVKKAAGQAGELIDDLLEFSRLGRIGIDFRPTNMTELAKQGASELTLAHAGPAVDLTIGDLPLCHGDWRLLKLVWANLLSNAMKFTRGRPVPQIEVGWLPDDRRPDYVVYYVKDNGVGFDMKYVHKLFGVFQRLHLKDEFEGTGVGLAIVQRIVHRHQGRVWAEGKIDGGATLYFSLRKARQ